MDDEKKFQHGVITHRHFKDLYVRFDFDLEGPSGGDIRAAGSHAPEAGTAVECELCENSDENH